MDSNSRSPNYPALDLPSAIDKARDIFRGDGRRPVGLEVVAKRMGNSAKSSTFRQNIAAMRAYGFLQGTASGGHRLEQLTKLALDIVTDYPEGSPEHTKSVKEAARNPRIHAELWERYGEDLPSDDEVRRYLVHEKGFADKAVGEFIERYKAALVFSGLYQSGKQNTGSVPVDPDTPAAQETTISSASCATARPRSLTEKTRTNVSVNPLPEGNAVLEWPTGLSRESSEDLQAWLEHNLRKINRSTTAGSPDGPL